LTWLIAGIVGGACVGLIATLLGLYTVILPSLHASGSHSANRLRLQRGEIERSFDRLEAISTDRCSPDFLAEMRSIVLETYTIRDAAYRQDNVVLCSSGAGQVRVSIDSFGPPLFRATSGAETWRNVELPSAPGVKSTIIMKGNFSLMVAPTGQQSRGGSPVSTVLVNPLSGAVTTIYGPRVGLSAAALLSHTPIRRGLRIIFAECLEGPFVCQVQMIGLKEIWREFSLPIVLLVLLGSAIGSGVALFILKAQRKRATFENRLRRALGTGEISLEYQPIIDLGSGRIAGAEALMRWTLRSNDKISPTAFIACAEQSSLITDLTCFAIETASRELRNLLEDEPDFVISINIVSRDLTDPRFLLALETHIVAKGIDPRRIALELTERQPIDTPGARATIVALHAKGYRIYIDDFGTGYSNLAYLGELSVDTIKVDMIFTQSVGSDNIRARLIPSILGMAKELGIAVIVEGIETEDQERYFQLSGANFAQGWRYSPSLPASGLLSVANSTQPPWSLTRTADRVPHPRAMTSRSGWPLPRGATKEAAGPHAS
jgi:sensor c-di-GMP phosphodiesterase-like protein